MPAIPVLLQWLIIAFFGADILKKYGFNVNQADLNNGITGMGAAQPASPNTAGATAEKSTSPTFAQTANDAVKNPSSILFLGVAGVGLAVLFSQVRAGLHEGTETAREVYREGSRGLAAASGADGGPKNYSRRMKS